MYTTIPIQIIYHAYTTSRVDLGVDQRRVYCSLYFRISSCPFVVKAIVHVLFSVRADINANRLTSITYETLKANFSEGISKIFDNR